MAEPWKVNGTYFEACNCAAACPCVFLSAPTEGKCTVLLAWHIDKGNFGALPINGLNVALLALTPGHMMQTKWKVALYMDDKASGDQQKALGAIFSGQAGGHLAALAPLIGEVMEGQGGALVTVENHPFTPVPGHPAVVSTSKKLKFTDHGISLDISGKNGFYSAFAYQS